jgi:hypothetical protein
MKRRPVEVHVTLPYTLEAANNTLPLVRRIVDDLSHRYADWQDALSKFEYATTRSSADAPDPEADVLEQAAKQLAVEIDGYVAELAELGIECIDFATGLIEFPGDDAPFLWQRGDAAVGVSSERD